MPYVDPFPAMTVDPNALTIANITLSGHVFYPGTAQLSVTQGQESVVSLKVVGNGTGSDAGVNQIAGPFIVFGLGMAFYLVFNPDPGAVP